MCAAVDGVVGINEGPGATAMASSPDEDENERFIALIAAGMPAPALLRRRRDLDALNGGVSIRAQHGYRPWTERGSCCFLS